MVLTAFCDWVCSLRKNVGPPRLVRGSASTTAPAPALAASPDRDACQVQGRRRQSPMLPDAATGAGREAAGRPRPGIRRDRGHTIVCAHAGTATARAAWVLRAARAPFSVLTAPCRCAVRHLPVAPSQDMAILLDVCVGSSWYAGRVPQRVSKGRACPCVELVSLTQVFVWQGGDQGRSARGQDNGHLGAQGRIGNAKQVPDVQVAISPCGEAVHVHCATPPCS